MSLFMADTFVHYTLNPVRLLTPVSLDYDRHVHIFTSVCAVFTTLFVCYLVDANGVGQVWVLTFSPCDFLLCLFVLCLLIHAVVIHTVAQF